MSSRRKFIQNVAWLSGATLLPPFHIMGNLFGQLPGQMQLIRRNVGFFTERGGTIGWLINASGITVIDSQFPEQAGHLIDQVRQQSKLPFDLLINTHHHGDHTSGNIAFQNQVARVVSHVNCRENQQKQAKERNTEAQQLYADATFEQQWSQSLGDEKITAQYFGAAHTNGDIVVHFEQAEVAHLGDLVFNRRFPYIDRPGGANIASWIAVLQRIRRTYSKDTQYIFGHAAEGYQVVGTHADIGAFENYLESLLETVGKAIKAGKTKEEILGITAIPGAPEWKGEGIARSLTAAWEELQ